MWISPSWFTFSPQSGDRRIKTSTIGDPDSWTHTTPPPPPPPSVALSRIWPKASSVLRPATFISHRVGCIKLAIVIDSTQSPCLFHEDFRGSPVAPVESHKYVPRLYVDWSILTSLVDSPFPPQTGDRGIETSTRSSLFFQQPQVDTSTAHHYP